jgi:hypothetical protein|tara:strand:- start:160 stop:585 length:426 start_codon:yes stop_codon:yes gene_type:complete
MNTQEKYSGFMKKLNGNSFNNPSMGSLSNRSIGDQELDQRTKQNILTSNMLMAHHINPEAGAGIGMDGFTEPSLEDLVQMVKDGKIEKSVLGEDADLLLQESKNKDEAKRRADFEATGSLEIPVIPFDDPGKQFLMNKIKK